MKLVGVLGTVPLAMVLIAVMARMKPKMPRRVR